MTSNYGVVAAYDPMLTNSMDVTFVPPSLTPESHIKHAYTNPYPHSVLTSSYTPPI